MRATLDDLKPGMTLSVELIDSGGRLLLPAGTELTDRHLRYFHMWGVTEIEIEGDDRLPDHTAALDPAVRAAVEARLGVLFRNVNLTHPAAAQVYAHCLARELRRAATAEPADGR
jgi:hypothetical protein